MKGVLADHGTLHCSRMAILAIRSDCFYQLRLLFEKPSWISEME